MGLGRIATLLGALTPAAEPQQAQPDLALGDQALPAAVATDGSHDRSDHGGKPDMAVQIQAVIAAIRQLDDHAGQDGAGMAFSRSGATLRDSVGGLGHLMAAARDSGTALPGPLVKSAAEVVGAVEQRLASVEAGIEERAHRLPAADEARVRETGARFVAEMQGVIAQTRGVLARFGV